MSVSRRTLLKNVGVLGAVASIGGIGCSKEDDASSLDTPFHEGVASGDPLPTAVILWTRVTSSAASVDVKWEMSSKRDFSKVDASGTVTTNADRDYTVKVDATGLLAGTTYYYRFIALGKTSMLGRTRTAPTGGLARLRLGVVSCSSLAHGYFHAYRQLATRTDLDAIVHLGDYIYEYGDREYGDVRKYEPLREIVSLADYRTRYAQYRHDPDLAALHQQFPFITTWDDHESADNSYANGAKNHDPGDGDWTARKAASARAYSEWMPIRDQVSGKIYRGLVFGDLVDLTMLDTRIAGRDQQIEKTTDPGYADLNRTLLGKEQEAWLASRIAASTAKWVLLGQQVVVAPFPAFFNGDGWDGYPGARERLYTMLEMNAAKNVVVLTGDIHMSFGFDLVRDPAGDYDPMTGKGSVGVELVCPGVTSPGYPAQLKAVGPALVKDHKHVKFADVYQRGYMVLDITHERVQAAWYHYTEVAQKEATPKLTAAWSVKAGTKMLFADTEAPPPADAPPAV